MGGGESRQVYRQLGVWTRTDRPLSRPRWATINAVKETHLTPRPAWQLPDLCDRWPLRLVFAGCQGAAIWLTWNLWQVRPHSPPNLPLIDAAWVDGMQINFGWPLLASLVLAGIWPKVGVIAHVALLALAIGLDQMRIQPEFVSVAILLVGTLPRRGPILVTRCHMVSLWCFGGIHKLLSPEYWTETGPYLARMLLPWLGDDQAVVVGIVIACMELATGVLAVLPITRRAVPWLATGLHLGILLSLVVEQWNSAVWPWNIALAAAGWGFFAGWQGQLLAWDDGPQTSVPAAANDSVVSRTALWQRRLWQAAGALALVHPALYYVDGGDAYFSWCVYSSNTPEGIYYDALDYDAMQDDPTGRLAFSGGEKLLFREYERLNIPFPPRRASTGNTCGASASLAMPSS